MSDTENFTLRYLSGMSRIVIGIPHGSIAVPADQEPPFAAHVTPDFLRSQSDGWTGDIYAVEGVRTVSYPWHRFVADPNRSERQKTEGGVVPDQDFELVDLYDVARFPTPAQRMERVRRYHRRYHEELALAVGDPATAFFLDGHSMSETAPPRGPDFGKARPDAVLSNLGDLEGDALADGDPLTCPAELTRAMSKALTARLLETPPPKFEADDEPDGTVWINDPFIAGYGVRAHASVAQGVPGLQVEFNQRLWIDEATYTLLPGRIEWLNGVIARWCADIERLLKVHAALLRELGAVTP